MHLAMVKGCVIFCAISPKSFGSMDYPHLLEVPDEYLDDIRDDLAKVGSFGLSL